MRRIMLGVTASALAITALTAGPASAGCGTGNGAYAATGQSGSVTQIGPGDASDGSYYIDDRDATGSGIFVYREVNTQSGLQRGGSRFIVLNDDCYESATPDELVF